jgi:EAL domain-containing protein (putative c-di-GMP-specific phosphodiesterase class I)
LRELNCELGQGFLYSPPVPAEEAELFLREGAFMPSSG